jgi:hypothetical protein
MKHSLISAAIAAGLSKSTIYRAIKSGKMSAHFEDGVYTIDPSELHRVFPPVSSERVMKEGMTQSETHDETPVLRKEVEFLKQQVEREREFVKSLERRLDDSDAERRKLTALLTFQQEQPVKVQKEPVKKENKLWKKLFR